MRYGRLGFLMALGLFMVAWGSEGNAFGQGGVSSASVSRVRSEMNRPVGLSGPPPAPDAIAVEEIVNYHRHRLPLPRLGQGVRMDVRWGN